MRIVVITGAGISAESGLSTFKDGLWDEYKIEEVCSVEAIKNNPQKVIEFYNARRREVNKAQPNIAHIALAELAKHHKVKIITQNVDDLHERAGSDVLHLHGEINKLRSTFDKNYIIEWKEDQTDQKDPYGEPMRPHIVLYGEAVPKLNEAIDIVELAEVIIVIGTSMQVYPANTLLEYNRKAKVYYVDPNPDNINKNLIVIKDKATVAVPKLVKEIIENK